MSIFLYLNNSLLILSQLKIRNHAEIMTNLTIFPDERIINVIVLFNQICVL